MFLKNYTSNVPVSETIARIEKVLIRCGVLAINKEYAPPPASEITAILFSIETHKGKVDIRLPIDTNRAWDALWKDYVGIDTTNQAGTEIWSNNRKRLHKKDFLDQAKRTAWKIMQDWVEVQMSMIQLKQAEPRQIFLPYVVTDSGETVYQMVQGSGFRALLPEKCE